MPIKVINHEKLREKRRAKLSEAELNYYAGFFDADGYVSIVKGRSGTCRRGISYSLKVGVTQKWPAILTDYEELWGGSIKHRAGIFYWRIWGANAHRCLSDLLPFLRLKNEEAKLAMKFHNIHLPTSGRLLTDKDFELQEACYLKMQELRKNRK